MRLKVTDNLAQVERDLDAFVDAVMRRAVPRAINTLAGNAETAALRTIADQFQVPQGEMRKSLTTKLASADNPEATLVVRGASFGPAVYKPLPTAKGVSVLIKGRRVVIPHAFIVNRFGRAAFARGAYGGRGITPTGEAMAGFIFGRRRFPIAHPLSWGPSSAFAARQVVDAMGDRIEEQAPKVLEREIKAALRGF